MLVLHKFRRSCQGSAATVMFAVLGCSGLFGCGGRTSSDHVAGREPTVGAPDDVVPNETSETLAVIVDKEVKLLSLDGSSRKVFDGTSFFSGISGVHFAGRVGDYFSVEGYPDADSGGMRMAVVSSSGTVKWQRTYPWSEAVHSDHSEVTLGSDGTVVLQRDGGLSGLALDENSSDLAGASPLGESVAGFVPVEWTSNGTAMEYGWWQVGGTGPLVNSEIYRGTDALVSDNPVYFGGRLLHLGVSNGQVALVSGTPKSVTEIPVPLATAKMSINYNPTVAALEDEHWLLISSGASNDVLRVDLASGATSAVHLVAPAGYRSFSSPCQDQAPQHLAAGVDTDGYIYGVFRTNDHAAVFTTLNGQDWTQVGGSITSIGGLGLTVHSTTYVIQGHETVDCYGDGPTWSDASQAEFSGDVTQIVRRASGARLVAQTNGQDDSYQYSRTGRYAAHWEASTATPADKLWVVDLETGTRTAVATDASDDHSAPEWLPSE